MLNALFISEFIVYSYIALTSRIISSEMRYSSRSILSTALQYIQGCALSPQASIPSKRNLHILTF